MTTTIASEVRRLFLQIVLDEIIQLQDRAETLMRAEMFDAELKAELTAAYEHLFKARCRCDDVMPS